MKFFHLTSRLSAARSISPPIYFHRLRYSPSSVFYPIVLVACLTLAATTRADNLTNHAAGPTLQLAYTRSAATDNTVTDFMYFIPLISPEPVSITSTDRTNQIARITSFSRKDHASAFHIICEFEFMGEGSQQNLIDQTEHIRRHERQFAAGKPMRRLLSSINVRGPGKGSVEVDGAVTNGRAIANVVRFTFNNHGQTSPVSINLEDIVAVNSANLPTNEIVARVNTLTFERKPGAPAMEVSIASLKPKSAKEGLWQNFKAGLKGSLANLFIPPLTITTIGQQTILDFGTALANETPIFTFPLATNIVTR